MTDEQHETRADVRETPEDDRAEREDPGLGVTGDPSTGAAGDGRSPELEAPGRTRAGIDWVHASELGQRATDRLLRHGIDAELRARLLLNVKAEDIRDTLIARLQERTGAMRSPEAQPAGVRVPASEIEREGASR
ncbi:hypothetical protein ACFOYW_16680 [Gryllotalpicola reticulitermitis]|uniref:Uncharacterized protein n=1 Tax=Gryllotalpicola reticulitermitis TaxID=1184153 RepID=A0ABV8Q9F8_9MICO